VAQLRVEATENHSGPLPAWKFATWSAVNSSEEAKIGGITPDVSA